MKIRTHARPREQASLLLTSLFIAGIIGVTLVGYLTLTQVQNTSTYRSQIWNQSLVVTEAGVEEGLALVNKYYGTTTAPQRWTNSAAADGWDSPAANVYHVRRYLNADYYDTWITNLNDTPTIKATGTVRWNYSYASAEVQPIFAVVGQSGKPTAQRAVLVTTSRAGPFSGAFLVKNGIILSGAMVIDSFNSQDPNYSINGQYAGSKHKDGGDIATIQSNVVKVVSESGGARVYGHVATGPNSTVYTSGGAAIGSTDWIDGGGQGVQPGWWRNDMNVVIPDVTLPNVAWFSSSGIPGFPGTINGTSYNYVVPSGNYKITGNGSISGGQNMCIVGAVTLYFANTGNNSFTISGSGYVNIPPGSSLTVYAAGTVTLSGGGLVNTTGYATNCTYYGLPTNTKITYSGGSGYNGTFYGPEADFTMSGGTGTNFIGSVVANSANVSGNYGFHYDESLSSGVQGSYYHVASWAEVQP